MITENQKLNWEADRLEGLIYNCCECDVERKLVNDEIEDCPLKECKWKTQLNNILETIKDRTQAL